MWELLFFILCYLFWYWIPMKLCHFHILPYVCFVLFPYVCASLMCDGARTGSRQWGWFRSLRVWKHARRYFPLEECNSSAVGMAEVSSMNSCLFVAHPHGVFAWSILFTYMLHGGCNPMFCKPNTVYVGVAHYLFYVPILRDLLLWSGAVDKRHLLDVVGDPHKIAKRHIVILPGDSVERLSCDSSNHNLTSVHNERSTIMKDALFVGMGIFPVFCKNEDLLYRNLASSYYLKRFYEFTNRWIDRPVPQLAFGAFYSPVPLRVKLQVCTGEPLMIHGWRDAGDEKRRMEANRLEGLFYTRFSELYTMHCTKSLLRYTQKNV